MSGGETRFRNGVLYLTTGIISIWLVVAFFIGIGDSAVVNERFRLKAADMRPSAVVSRAKEDSERFLVEYITLALCAADKVPVGINLPKMGTFMGCDEILTLSKARFAHLGWIISCIDTTTGHRLYFAVDNEPTPSSFSYP